MTIFFLIAVLSVIAMGMLFGIRLVVDSLHQAGKLSDKEYMYFLDSRHLYFLIKKTYIDHEYPKI